MRHNTNGFRWSGVKAEDKGASQHQQICTAWCDLPVDISTAVVNPLCPTAR